MKRNRKHKVKMAWWRLPWIWSWWIHHLSTKSNLKSYRSRNWHYLCQFFSRIFLFSSAKLAISQKCDFRFFTLLKFLLVDRWWIHRQNLSPRKLYQTRENPKYIPKYCVGSKYIRNLPLNTPSFCYLIIYSVRTDSIWYVVGVRFQAITQVKQRYGSVLGWVTAGPCFAHRNANAAGCFSKTIETPDPVKDVRHVNS